MTHETFMSQKSQGFETHNSLNTENTSDIKASMLTYLHETHSLHINGKNY